MKYITKTTLLLNIGTDTNEKQTDISTGFKSMLTGLEYKSKKILTEIISKTQHAKTCLS